MRAQAFPTGVSLPAVVAGLVAALVGYSGPFVIVLQATRAAHLDAAHTASWVWALGVGSGVAGIALSALTRMPVVVAWSTPGAALLIATLGGYRFSDAVGAFCVASLVACVLGVTGWFGALLSLVPAPLLSALLAGVLLPFVVHGADAVATAPVTAGLVVVAYLVGRRLAGRWAVALALAVGLLAAAAAGDLRPVAVPLRITAPVWTTPTLDPAALLAIGLPLLVVTMASQNAPGLTVLRTAGYTPDDRLLVGGVSLVSAVLTPFGGHASNLAAITAAIVAGPSSDRDPARRWVGGISCGALNLFAGLFAATVVVAFGAVPAAVVTAVAAVALLPSLLGALATATAAEPTTATAAVVGIATTASGVVVAGIGSAFWGLLASVTVWLVLRPRAAIPTPPTPTP